MSWARLRRKIASDVQQLKNVLTHHRAAGLPEADLKVIRRGKALEYFSKHYGQVFVEEDRMIDLRTALAGINQLLDDEHTAPADVPPLTAEALTRQFLRLFNGTSEMKRDEMQKTLRGTGIGAADFEKKGWCVEEKKVFHFVNPLDWARSFKGANRSKLSRDLDRTLFLIGACYPDSGIRLADTLNSPNFRLRDFFLWHGDGWSPTSPHARDLSQRRCLVVAGLEAALDAMEPEAAETWLEDVLRPVIKRCGNDLFGGEQSGALIFWRGWKERFIQNHYDGRIRWHCEGEYRGQDIRFSTGIWNGAFEDVQRIVPPGSGDEGIGFYLQRIS